MRVLLLTVVLILIDCSVSSKHYKGSRINNRPIVGGVDTDIGKYPYQVSVVFLENSDESSEENAEKSPSNDEENAEESEPSSSHFCGGSVISVDWVLCAGHCLEGRSPRELAVRVGTSTPNKGGVLHDVEKIIVHSDYHKNVALDCDIGLIKVKKPFEIGANVQPIPLNTHPLRPGSIVIVTGWGTTTTGGDMPEMPEILQKVEVPIVPQWECEWLYGKEKLTEYMFCAGRAGRDSCQGDSGGPVMADGKQIGVVSWGEGCGLAGYPGIYTNVYKFREWIRKNSGV